MADRNAFRNRQRPAPYQKREVAPVPIGNSDGQWTHDLFDTSSSLYNPKVSPAFAPPAPVVSRPSLRPFGTVHASSRVVSPKPIKETPDANKSLADRLSGAPSSLSLIARVGIEQQGKARKQRSSLPLDQPPSPQHHAPRPPARRHQPDMDHVMEQEEPIPSGGIKIRVANLVEGTSAEDVRTAFSQFGDILDASIADHTTTGAQGRKLLVAQILFRDQASADKAVELLNGAVADGETLEVAVVRDPPRRKAQPRTKTTPTAPRSMRQRSPPATHRTEPPPQQSVPNLFARLGLPQAAPAQAAPQRRPNAQRQPQAAQRQRQAPRAPTIEAAPASGSMRADFLAQIDPRAATLLEPEQVRVMTPKEQVRHARWMKTTGTPLSSRIAGARRSNDMDLS